LVVLPLLVLLATACRGGYRGTIAFTGEPKPTDIPQNIPDVLEADQAQRFTILLDLVDKAGLTTTLSGPGPLTLFAPTNAAFHAAFTDAQLAALSEQTATLKKMLEGHFTDKDVSFSQPPYVTEVTGGGTTVLKVDGKTDIDDAGLIIVTTPKPLTMENDTTLTIAPDKTITVPDSTAKAKITDPDIQAPNGFIQVVDRVLASAASIAPAPST